MSRALVAERLSAQRVSGEPLDGPVAVARHLLAVQAQDGRGARLAVRARTTRPGERSGERPGERPGEPPGGRSGAGSSATVAELDRALTVERSLVISWLCRGTLHLVAAEDFAWLHALTTPPLRAASRRRLAQEGVPPGDAERAVAEIRRALADAGPLTRAQLGDRVAALGVRVAGQALVHVLLAATLDGICVRGPMIGRRHAYVLADDWLGPPGRFDRDAALAELARRYLAGHGPASDRDLGRWAGLPLRDARAGLAAIAAELVERPDGLIALRGAPAEAELPAPRLLGPWDPLMVGWTDRSWVTGAHDAKLISGGLFRPFALVGGRAVGAWSATGDRLRLGQPFVPVSRRDRAALDADAVAVAGYLGLGDVGGLGGLDGLGGLGGSERA